MLIALVVLAGAIIAAVIIFNNQKVANNSVYDGIDWDKIPEAPASDFGYRVYYGEPVEDPDYVVGYRGDGSEFVRSIHIFDYYGHDKFVKIPKEIDGLPVTVMENYEGFHGYRKYPWDPNSEWIEVRSDGYVFKDSGVEGVFIPEHLRNIDYKTFDDCPTLRSISVDSNNLVFFSEDGVLFLDNGVVRGTMVSTGRPVFTKLPKYSYTYNNYGVPVFNEDSIEDKGETVLKTLDFAFYNCYIDDSFEKSGFLLGSHDVYKFTDGTYGVADRGTGGYLPIDESHFKRLTAPYLFRYPEGKTDESYTVKDRCWVDYNKNGNEQARHDNFFYVSYTGGSNAFKNVQFLKEIKFEEGVESIKYGIQESASIESISIPSSLVSIGDSFSSKEGYHGSFNKLINLKEYKVDENNTVFKSVDGALLSKDGKILYSMPCKIGENYSVPDRVEMISGGAFANAKNMTINIPASVKYLAPRKNPFSSPDVPKGGTPAIFSNSSDITLNVSSKTEIRDIFEGLPELAEKWDCPGITVNFVD